MVSVNGDAPPAHVARLLWAALQRARAEGMALVAADPEAIGPVSAAHARLLDHLPPEGARVTELAARMRITKQALGQLATQLADKGYVETVADPSDRRAKLIRCTASGDRARRALCAIALALEDRWRREVGDDRYAVFREVLAQLGGTDRADPDAPPPVCR
jgi:DNA-binding MarR family transcriptional regulator